MNELIFNQILKQDKHKSNTPPLSPLLVLTQGHMGWGEKDGGLGAHLSRQRAKGQETPRTGH